MVEKLEVLRSDSSIRYNINTISDIPEEDIKSMKISRLLDEAGTTNVDIENEVEETATDENVLIGQRTPISDNTFIESKLADIRQVYTYEYSKIIKNNKMLEILYEDYIRGNVIRAYSFDPISENEFDYSEVDSMIMGDKSVDDLPMTNSHREYKTFFLISQALKYNMISNCFKGHDLSNGAALSFWIRGNLEDYTKFNIFSLLLFIGDYEKHYFDQSAKDNDNEYVLTTPYLYVTNSLGVYYKEAFDNKYKLENDLILKPELNTSKEICKAFYRSNKQWIHVILSITNDGIVPYVNGLRIPVLNEDIGAKFKDNEDFPVDEFKYRTPILDFISNEKTNLFLNTSINASISNHSMLFDDVTFYKNSVSDDNEAMSIFNEALEINLP